MKRSTKIRIRCQGASVPFYPAALPLSAQTMTYVAAVIRRHRKKIGSCWRKLSRRQALLVLAYLRKGETFADLAAGFGIGTATAWGQATKPTLPGAPSSLARSTSLNRAASRYPIRAVNRKHGT